MEYWISAVRNDIQQDVLPNEYKILLYFYYLNTQDLVLYNRFA